MAFGKISAALLLLLCSFVTLAQSDLTGIGAVASPDQYGAATAKQILLKGGNAVDAAVATAFTLAVTYPEAGNIGGGGFMTLWFEGKPYFLDYRETAPGKAHRDMYLDKDKQLVPDVSLIGHKASGVPGTVMGLWQAHQRFGSLSWSELIKPAIHYAKTGFTVAENQYQYRADLHNQLKGKTIVMFFNFFSSHHFRAIIRNCCGCNDNVLRFKKRQTGLQHLCCRLYFYNFYVFR